MFYFVRFKNNVSIPPSVVNVYASGTINRGSVVEFSRTNNRVEPAGANTTFTTVFGIALDYAQGASDSIIRVIPLAPGQVWEADCANTVSTAQLFIRHALNDNLNLNNSATDQNSAKGIFLAYGLGNTLNIKQLIGEFIKVPISGQV